MKDKLFQTLYRWLQYLGMMTAEPAFIPLTKEEIEILQGSSVGYHTGGFLDAALNVFGKPVHESAYAVEMRQRQLTMPVFRLVEDVRVPLLDAVTFRRDIDHENGYLRRRIIAKVCCDHTQLLIRLEWDCWAAFKRALRITKWFPVKYRTVAVEGRVLYPYLTVSLPHNIHHVQFAVTPHETSNISTTPAGTPQSPEARGN